MDAPKNRADFTFRRFYSPPILHQRLRNPLRPIDGKTVSIIELAKCTNSVLPARLAFASSTTARAIATVIGKYLMHMIHIVNIYRQAA